MSELIIIAGPQAAGKSTVIEKLAEHYQGLANLLLHKHPPLLFCMQESRQVIVHKYMLLGGIFMSQEHEEEVIECDLARMDRIQELNQQQIYYVDECNIFTLAHAAAHGILNVESYWNFYLRRLEQLQAKVVFLTVTPEISWARRKPSYEKRLIYFPESEHAEIMENFRQYIERLFSALFDIYDKLPIPKMMVEADRSEHIVFDNVCAALSCLITSF